jgi:hypothetical protein
VERRMPEDKEPQSGADSLQGPKGHNDGTRRKPPNLLEHAYDWIVRRFGVRTGIFLVVLFAVTSFAWSGFKDEIKKSDIWQNIAEHFNAIPKADPGTMSVFLANLDGDIDGSTTDIVFDSIKTAPGITAYRLNRRIRVPERPSSMSESDKFDEIARSYLKQTGGRVLIWGRVFKRGPSDFVPQLYWTVSTDEKGGWQNNYAPTPDARLPLLFNQDMAWALQAILSKQSPVFDKSEHPPSIDEQRAFVENLSKVTDVVDRPSSGKCPVNPPAVRLWVMLANAKALLAQMSGDPEMAQNAARTLQSAEFYYRCAGDDVWADLTLNDEVRAAYELSTLTGRTNELVEADAALSRGLEEAKSRGIFVDSEAKSVHCLALIQLASLLNPAATREEAYSVCSEAAQRPLQTEDALKWAENQSHLGLAEMILASKNGDRQLLVDSIAVLHNALSAIDVEKNPLDWARTQLLIGDALSLGGGNNLLLAVGAYRNSIRIFSDRSPVIAGTLRIRACSDLARYSAQLGNVKVGHQAISECKLAVDQLTHFSKTSAHSAAVAELVSVKLATAILENNRADMIEARNDVMTIVANEPVGTDPYLTLSLHIFLCNADGALAHIIGSEPFAASSRAECEKALAFPDLERVSPISFVEVKIGLANSLQTLSLQLKDESLHRAAVEALQDARRTAAAGNDSGNLVVVDALLARVHKNKSANLGLPVTYLEMSATTAFHGIGTHLSAQH